MAKRRTAAEPADPAKRRRRTPEEIIADLERKIEEVKQRQETTKLRKSAAVRATLSAVRALDKGLTAAEQEGDTALRHALADAREPLSHLLGERGVKIERTRRPKGPRPK